MHEPKSETPRKRSLGLYLYVLVFIVATCATTVILSLRGFISFDPLSALIAGLFVGVAFVMFQLTYMRFIVNSSRHASKTDSGLQ